MTLETLEKANYLNRELTKYKNSVDRFNISIYQTSLDRETEIVLEKEAENLIKSKLKARIEELEKELEAL